MNLPKLVFSQSTRAFKNITVLSIRAHKAWKEGGCLRSGPLNDNRLLCKKRYKLAIRETKRNAGKNIDSKLADSLIVNDQKIILERMEYKL